jgi:hypothetical protein
MQGRGGTNDAPLTVQTREFVAKKTRENSFTSPYAENVETLGQWPTICWTAAQVPSGDSSPQGASRPALSSPRAELLGVRIAHRLEQATGAPSDPALVEKLAIDVYLDPK